jgi:hypothetical protein
MANTDALRTRVGGILMSSAAQAINFFLDSFHVDGSGLSFVALALASKPKGVHGVTFRLGHVKHGAAATYSSSTNIFDFPAANYGTTDFERMTIVHECVHALRDANGPKLRTTSGPRTTLTLSNEAAAYLAGALFWINENSPPPPAPPATPSWSTAPIYGTAHTIALKMITQSGFAVAPQDAKALRDAVMNFVPLYQNLKNAPKTRDRGDGLQL